MYQEFRKGRGLATQKYPSLKMDASSGERSFETEVEEEKQQPEVELDILSKQSKNG